MRRKEKKKMENRKAVSGIMTLLLTGILMLTLNIQPFGTFNLNATPIRAEENGGAVTVGTCPLGGYTHIYRDIITFTSHPEGHLMYYNISAGGQLTDTGIPGSDWLAIYEDTIAFLPYAGDVIGFYSISMGAAYYIPHPLGDYFDPRDLVLWAMNFPSRVVSIHSDITAFYDYYGEAGEEEPPVKIWYSIAGGDFIKIAEGSLGYGWGVSVYEDTIAFSQGGVIKYYNTTTAVTTNTGLTGTCPSIYEDIITFQFGSVIMYYNITSGTATNTGQAGEGPYIYGTCGKHMSIAYSASDIIMTYDVKTEHIANTGEVGKAPSMGYGGTVVFVVPDTEFWWVKFLPDLWLCEVTPVQVIWEGKRDEASVLVKEKKTVFNVVIGSSFLAPVLSEVKITSRNLWFYDSAHNLMFSFVTPKFWILPGVHDYYVGPKGGHLAPIRCVCGRQHPLGAWVRGDWVYYSGNYTKAIDTIEAFVNPNGNNPVGEAIWPWNNINTRAKTVAQTRQLRVLYVPIGFVAAQDLLRLRFLGGLTDMARHSTDFLITTYPSSDVWPLNTYYGTRLLPMLFTRPPGVAGPPPWPKAGLWNMMTRVARLRNLGYDVVVAVAPDYARAAGGTWPQALAQTWDAQWFQADGLGWAPGWATPGALRTEGWAFVEGGQWIVTAHEIGHLYGQGPHYARYAQRYWIESATEPIVHDFENADMNNIMNPRLPLPYETFQPEWIDLSFYEFLLRNNPVEPYLVDPEVIAVSGMIFQNGTVVPDEDWYHFAEGTPDILPGTTGNYSVVLLNATGQVLSQVGFNASFWLSGYGTDLVQRDSASFAFSIPWENGTHEIQIRNATDHVLVSRFVSTNSPTVTVTFPNGGEILLTDQNYTITWEASDLDGDPLTYALLLSDDGGSTWLPVDMGISVKNYTLLTNYLPTGSKYLVKVIATDGVNTGEDVSDGNFTIAGHDVAITNITPSKTVVGQGYSLSINVTIENQGDYTETFNVTIYADTTSITTQTITLTSGNSTTITFIWNTSGFAYGNYTISAYAWPVPDETHTEDNTLIDGWVIVTIPGDVNGNHLADISDLVITVGTIPSAPGWSNWNPNTDINGDGVCDVSDLVICVGNIPSGPW
jgi:hypothetical protein